MGLKCANKVKNPLLLSLSGHFGGIFVLVNSTSTDRRSLEVLMTHVTVCSTETWASNWMHTSQVLILPQMFAACSL